MILYDCWLLPAQFYYIFVYIWKIESRVQIADPCIPRKIYNSAEKFSHMCVPLFLVLKPRGGSHRKFRFQNSSIVLWRVKRGCCLTTSCVFVDWTECFSAVAWQRRLLLLNYFFISQYEDKHRIRIYKWFGWHRFIYVFLFINRSILNQYLHTLGYQKNFKIQNI